MDPGALRHAFAPVRRVRAVYAIVIALILVQVAISMLPAGWQDTGLKCLGLRRESWLNGDFWQIFTYGIVHGGWSHLAFNAAGVLLLGMRIEWVLGASGFLRVCGWGILAGGGLHLAVAPAGVDAPVLVGFSGAVVALLLALTTLSPESRMWPLPVSGRALGLGILLAEGILTVIDPALGVPGAAAIGAWVTAMGGTSWFKIAHACHLGGGLAGWLCGRWILRRRVTLKNLRRARERGEAG